MQSRRSVTLPFWMRLSLAWLAFLLLFALYWVQLHTTQQHQLQDAEQQALLRAEQTAHALAMQANSKLLKIEFFVEHLTEHWLDHDPQVFKKLIGLGQESIFKGALNMVAVTDAEGNIIFNNVTDNETVLELSNLKDRHYFQQHARQYSNFVISQPLQNRLTEQWTVQFSHSYFKNSEFAGIVIISVPSEFLSDAFTQLYPDDSNIVLMTLNDGRYLTRSHGIKSHLGKSVPSQREFVRNLWQTSGHYETVAPIDNIERYYAWYRVPGFPVVLSLGLNKSTVLEHTLESIESTRKQGLLASALVLLAALLLTRVAITRAHQNRLLLQGRERLEVLLDRIHSGVLLEDENNVLAAVNPKLCKLLDLNANPVKLKGLPHEKLLQMLKPEYAQHLPAPTDIRLAAYRKEIQDESGRTLEIEWVPVRRSQRYLGHCWFIQDISHRKQKEQELVSLASRDPLTNLLNRRSFMELLEKSIQASQPIFPGALLFLDIDHFKQVNDTHGHPAGDLVLKNIAKIIRSCLRKDDYTGRLGGEEFAVLLPVATEYQAMLLAERIRAQIEEAITDTASHSISVTISIGVTLLYGQSPQSVQDQADQALYQAKKQGRNRVCFYRPPAASHTS